MVEVQDDMVEIERDVTLVVEDVDDIEQDVDFIYEQQGIQDGRLLSLEIATNELEDVTEGKQHKTSE